MLYDFVFINNLMVGRAEPVMGQCWDLHQHLRRPTGGGWAPRAKTKDEVMPLTQVPRRMAVSGVPVPVSVLAPP